MVGWGDNKMNAALEFVKQKKSWLIAGLVILLILMAVFFLPNWILKGQIKKMQLSEIERVEYVEYTDAAFSSPIKIKKVLSTGKDKTILDNLIEEIDLVKREKSHPPQGNKVLFFYHSNGEIFNAYVEDNLLGFHYGNYWLQVERLNLIIEDMYIVEPLKIKSDSMVVES